MIEAASLRRMRWLRALALGSVISTYALIVVGAIVRATDSGLGCPDWPLCHGRIIPPMEFHTLIEYSHRLTATVTGALVVALGTLALLHFRRNRLVVSLALAAVGLLVLQVGLGGATVLTELSPTIVTIHMGMAAVMLGALTATFVITSPSWQPTSPADGEAGVDLRRLVTLTAVTMYALMLSGGYVRATDATYACVTWPLCQGEVLPSWGLGLVQMAHRFAAVLVGLFVILTSAKVWAARGGHPWLGMLSLALAGLFIAQVLAGAWLMWANVSTFTKALHVSLGMATWGVAVAMATVVFQRVSVGAGRQGSAAAAMADRGPR